jgi:hypothetical protein
MSRDQDVAEVAARIDGLLDDLGATVAALSAILTRPAPPVPGADDERLVPQ